MALLLKYQQDLKRYLPSVSLVKHAPKITSGASPLSKLLGFEDKIPSAFMMRSRSGNQNSGFKTNWKYILSFNQFTSDAAMSNALTVEIVSRNPEMLAP